jgi:hypothetical protein
LGRAGDDWHEDHHLWFTVRAGHALSEGPEGSCESRDDEEDRAG